MKNRIILVGLLSAVLFSCKEKIPIATETNTIPVKDTTYVTTVEAQSPRIVLAEEATGVQCPNCPDGAEKLREAEEANPGRLVIIGEHGGKLTDPIPGLSKDNFALNDVLLLFNTYFGQEPDKPAAVIDRVYHSSTSSYYVTARNTWGTLIAGRLAILPLMNLSVESVFEASSNQYYITVKGAYTGTTNKKQRLTIVLLESKIIDPQDDGSDVVLEYEHNHVLRTFLTDATGDFTGMPLLDTIATKEPGRVFEKTILFKVPANKAHWKLENMDIVAFVHNADGQDKDVQQVAKTKLKL